jgi:hypothetical protein
MTVSGGHVVHEGLKKIAAGCVSDHAGYVGDHVCFVPASVLNSRLWRAAACC